MRVLSVSAFIRNKGQFPVPQSFPLDNYGLFHYTFNCSLRGVAKFGIALGSGPRGLEFESRHSDHNLVP